MWLVGRHVDDKGSECGLWAVMWIIKDAMWLVGRHVDDKGPECEL